DATLLIAPGHEVLTLVPAEGYDFLSGSSIAAAHVSGIVALLLEREPALRASDVEPLLARTSRPVGRDGERGRVLVSACGALAELSAAVECGAVARRAARATPESRPLETH
ncbi:MAG: S8 family serine peptidase, partial [Steroidobacteraceae bacterium]